MHDKLRKEAQRYAKEARKYLIKNGRFFAAPQKSNENFKRLFARLAAEGAGRPVDKDGFADGPWTPESLADAITAIDGNREGVELRTVQVWFQDNDNGISDTNIRWLARIFGCGDPEATSRWQAELKAAKERLALERRARRRDASDNSVVSSGHETRVPVGNDTYKERKKISTNDRASGSVKEAKKLSKSLAERCEWALSSPTSMNLLIAYWLVFSGLGLLNYVFGTLSVTYRPEVGISKQVGFIWAPTLTVLPLIVLPLFIYYVSDLNTYWKQVGRMKCTSHGVISIKPHSHAAWFGKVKDYSFSFWAILVFCLLFVFGFQWGGIYLPAYLSGDANGVQIDRYLVALERPNVISIPQAMVLSAIGYLYTASYIAFFMFGLLFLVIVANDFHDVCMTSSIEGTLVDIQRIRKQGQKIIWGSFRVAVFAIWLATCVKLQITYLSSDSPDFVTWLRTDFLSAFNLTTARNGWLPNTSISHFTTFMMVAVTATIFVVCALRVHNIFEGVSVYESDYPFTENRNAIVKMLAVIGMLFINLILIGRFSGFSVLLIMCVAASFYVMSGPKLRLHWGKDGTSEILQ